MPYGPEVRSSPTFLLKAKWSFFADITAHQNSDRDVSRKDRQMLVANRDSLEVL